MGLVYSQENTAVCLILEFRCVSLKGRIPEFLILKDSTIGLVYLQANNTVSPI